MSDTIRTRTCADITPAAINWLWKPFLARGRLTVLDGDPNLGKSLVTIDLAARLSRGGSLPDGQPLDAPLTTVLLNAEDDPADTVRPRVAAAGADLSRVVADFSKSGPPELPECAERVFDLVCDHTADLLVIDPLAAFLPRGAANNDDRVRRALAPLAGVAAETGCAVLVVRHLGRSVGPNAVYRGGGSVGVLGVALTGLLLARHPEEPDLRVLAMTKSHLGPSPASLGFRLGATDAGPALQWAGAVDLSADELCVSQSAQAVRRPRERAAEFLRAALASGPRPVAELEKLAAERGLSWGTVRRAKEQLKLKAELVRKGSAEQSWQWTDPVPEAADRAGKRAQIAEAQRLLRGSRRRRTGDAQQG